MTPAEKAQELFDKYTPYMYCFMGSGMLSNTYDPKIVAMNAKECATIAVDEILNILAEEGASVAPVAIFYTNVKEEIQKI